MVDWGTVLATLIGGLLAIGGSVVSVAFARRRDTAHWYRQLQVGVAGELLAALQGVVRSLTTAAYVETPGVEGLLSGRGAALSADVLNSPDDVLVSGYYASMTAWNASVHRLAVSSPASMVQIARTIDVELDRLFGVAVERRWSRETFRAERRQLASLTGTFIDEARRANRLDHLELDGAWAWNED